MLKRAIVIALIDIAIMIGTFTIISDFIVREDGVLYTRLVPLCLSRRSFFLSSLALALFSARALFLFYTHTHTISHLKER